MEQIWKLRSTSLKQLPQREGEATFTEEESFLDAVRQKLDDPWSINISATLPDGRMADENQLTAMVGR